jgi:hypothetical protein
MTESLSWQILEIMRGTDVKSYFAQQEVVVSFTVLYM